MRPVVCLRPQVRLKVSHVEQTPLAVEAAHLRSPPSDPGSHAEVGGLRGLPCNRIELDAFAALPDMRKCRVL